MTVSNFQVVVLRALNDGEVLDITPPAGWNLIDPQTGRRTPVHPATVRALIRQGFLVHEDVMGWIYSGKPWVGMG